LAEFVAVYGDSFVSKIGFGGEYIALYVFYCETEEERSELASSLEVKSGPVSASFSAKFTNSRSSTTARSELYQYVSGTNVAMPKGEDAVDFALRFSAIPLDTPAVLDFETTGYEEVPGLTRAFSGVARNREYFCGDGGNVSLGLNGKLAKLTGIQNQIHDIESIYKFYGGHTDQQLADRLLANESDIATIMAQIHRYQADPAQVCEEPPVASLKHGGPRLMFEPHKNVCGSETGNAFDDIPNIRAFLRRKTRIASIALSATFYIQHLSTIYAHTSDKGEDVLETKAWGKDAGHPVPPLMMDKGVRLTGLSGAGAWNGGDPSLHMISFTDSDGITMTAGRTADMPFTWPMAKERFVLGFFGRSNEDGIRALGVHTAEFADAAWVA
jgi:hypothetical protein